MYTMHIIHIIYCTCICMYVTQIKRQRFIVIIHTENIKVFPSLLILWSLFSSSLMETLHLAFLDRFPLTALTEEPTSSFKVRENDSNSSGYPLHSTGAVLWPTPLCINGIPLWAATSVPTQQHSVLTQAWPPILVCPEAWVRYYLSTFPCVEVLVTLLSSEPTGELIFPKSQFVLFGGSHPH